jgi:hypothetical protein
MARWRTHNNRRKRHWRLDERGNYRLYARTRGWLWRDQIRGGIDSNVAATRALRERVDYLHVAVMRGDPRFARLEFVNRNFDPAAFDADWAARGKRVPTAAEVFGE